MKQFFKALFEEEWESILITPAIMWQAIFVLMPLIAILAYSFIEPNASGSGFALGFSSYKQVTSSLYLQALTRSLIFASSTTIVCALLAYPIAYFITFIMPTIKNILLLLLVLPSWTNLIVQIYAWFMLLQKNGLISSLFVQLGLTQSAPHLLNNYWVIIMGLVYCFLPFMVLPIYSTLSSIDKQLLEASADLGANSFTTFWKILFPMSRRGLFNGMLLVFVPSFGEYAAIEILGGSKFGLWGSSIVHSFLAANDFSTGSALTVLGIAFLLTAVGCVYTLWLLINYLFSSAQKPEQSSTGF